VAYLIDSRRLFREAQRMAQRQYLNTRPDLHARGARSNSAGDRQRRGANRPLGGHMDLGQPHGVETPTLSRIDLFERFRESRLLAGSQRALELVKHAELKRHRLLLPLLSH